MIKRDRVMVSNLLKYYDSSLILEFSHLVIGPKKASPIAESMRKNFTQWTGKPLSFNMSAKTETWFHCISI